MKKRLIAMLTVSALLTMTACAGDENVFSSGDISGNVSGNTSQFAVSGNEVADPVPVGPTVTIFDYDMTEYVEVGDYLGLELEFMPSEVTEDYLDYAYTTFINSYAEEVDPSLYVTDRAVRDGDMICLDYCGKKDGVAFDGGTATGAFLDIGSGTFIPGFEEGLVGVMPGEEVDLNLTFPENYHSPDLAGQSVVFTCTVQGIVTIDAILDTANQNLEVGYEPIESEEDLREMCREELERQVHDYDMSNLEMEISAKLPDIVTVKKDFPQELIDAYDALVLRSINNSASMYGVDAETLLSYYGYTVESYIAEYSRPQLINDAALYCIAVENGLLQTDEEFETSLTDYMNTYNVTREELLSQLSEDEYRVYFLEENTINFLLDRYSAFYY